MLHRLKTPAELAADEKEKTGASDWLSMWASVIVPMTALALGMFAMDNSDYMKDIRASKSRAEAIAAAAEKHENDSIEAHGKHFTDSLCAYRMAAGWCDPSHEWRDAAGNCTNDR